MSNRPLIPAVFVVILILLTGAVAAINAAAADESKNILPQNTRTDSIIEKGQSIRVLWTVSGYKRGANDKWQKEDADAMILKTLDMDDNSITFAGKNCKEVVFKRERQQLESYLMSRYAVTPQRIDLVNEEVELVKTNCTLPGFSEYLRLPDGRLVINIDGVFFFLEPVRF
jgi:hypothetical protein